MKTTKTRYHAASIAALLSLVIASRVGMAQSFSEPATVFYGKVLGTGSAQDFLVTAGELSWKIQRADGTELTLATTLFPLNNGELSYRVNVPHEAFALGLDGPSLAVPLPPSPETHLHKAITVDGETAVLRGPSGRTFTTEQLLRTFTYRLDLAIGRAALDSDGDGIPDDQEDAYGLDKQDGSDAGRDLSGDGISALEAYQRGLDPLLDARAPAVLTRETVVYRGGTTGILLDTVDLNSNPTQLTYTVTALPGAGSVILRNAEPDPTAPDAPLVAGSIFTQDDLLAGRVLYQHDGSDALPGTLGVTVRDENPQNPPATGDVQLLLFDVPGAVAVAMSAGETQRIDNAMLCGQGYVVLDGSPLASVEALSVPSAGLVDASLATHLGQYGPERPHLLVGGASVRTLTGGAADDVLTPGEGDATLAGGPGADVFTLRHFAAGRIDITDFSATDPDVIDLSGLPAEGDAAANRYVRLVDTPQGAALQVDLDGDGSGFTNLVVELTGMKGPSADLYALAGGGFLDLGPLTLEPRVTVAVSSAQASENGPTAGRFTVTREGDLRGAVTVNVSLGGVGQNGTDYEQIAPTVVIPAGASSVDVAVTPYADAVTESGETVQLQLEPGDGYHVGSAARATVTIEDRLMLVEIEALTPLAVKASGTSATFLVTRRDVVDRDALIRLNIGGTAANGTDYDTIQTYVLMAINQTSALIQVTPKAGAALATGMETVTLSIQPDAAYLVAGAEDATVAIVERLDRFSDWQAREFPSATGSLADFAAADSGNTGMTHLRRYAFGLAPAGSDKSGAPRALMVDGAYAVTFRRPQAVTDVRYQVSAATDLRDPQGTRLAVEQIPAPAGWSDEQSVFYRAVGGGDALAVFLAVEVEWTP